MKVVPSPVDMAIPPQPAIIQAEEPSTPHASPLPAYQGVRVSPNATQPPMGGQGERPSESAPRASRPSNLLSPFGLTPGTRIRIHPFSGLPEVVPVNPVVDANTPVKQEISAGTPTSQPTPLEVVLGTPVVNGNTQKWTSGDQEAADTIGIATKEYEDAKRKLDLAQTRAYAQWDSLFRHVDESLYLAEQQYNAARRVLEAVRAFYSADVSRSLSLVARTTTTLPTQQGRDYMGAVSPPSTPRTPSKKAMTPAQKQCGSNLSPSPFVSQPTTPAQKQCGSSPSPFTSQPMTPAQKQRGSNLSPSPSPSSSLVSPGTRNPNRKHYSVVVGRCVGVYSSW